MSELTVADQWTQKVLQYGVTLGEQLKLDAVAERADAGVVHTMYDALAVFEKLYRQTGDAKWLDYIDAALICHRDRYVLKHNGGVQPWYGQTEGLRLNFERTGDSKSAEAIVAIRTRMPYAGDATPVAWTESQVRSREVAFALSAYMNAISLGEPEPPRMQALYEQAQRHLDQWFASQPVADFAPFMFGLTARALIQHMKERATDAAAEAKLAFSAARCWDMAYIVLDKAMYYRANSSPTLGAPDLNGLVAPIYAYFVDKVGAGDFTGDGIVNQDDMSLVIGSWGADLDNGGTVPIGWIQNIPDEGRIGQEQLTQVLGNWGKTYALKNPSTKYELLKEGSLRGYWPSGKQFNQLTVWMLDFENVGV